MIYFQRPTVILLGLALLTPTSIVDAQGTDQRQANRRAFVEDLLRGLIDSKAQQVEPDNHNNHSHQQPPVGGQQLPQRQFPQSDRVPQVVIEATPQMRKVRNNLKYLARQQQLLISELQSMEYRSANIRPLLADALQARSGVANLARRADIYPRTEVLIPEYRAIDRDNRVLTHRLKSSGQLSPQGEKTLGEIHRRSNRLCELFGIDPQLDRRELLRLTTTLRSNFQHLLQDLYYESQQNQALGSVINDGRRLLADINKSTSLIQTANYETIVSAYQGCFQQWKNFNRQLFTVSNQRIVRDVQEIESLGTQIQDQLWLETKMDREYVAYLAAAVNDGATGVMNLVTLTHLVNSADPVQMVNNARELSVAGATLEKNIRSGQSAEDLAWDYRLFDVQWTAMHGQLTQLKDTLIDQKLNDIGYTVATLRRTLGDGPAIAPGEMLQIATSLDQLSYQLDQDLKQRLGASRYDARLKNGVLKFSDRLHHQVHDVQADLVAGRDPYRSPREIQKMVASWYKLKPLLAQLGDHDRRELAYYPSEIEPLMVKLSLVFSE